MPIIYFSLYSEDVSESLEALPSPNDDHHLFAEEPTNAVNIDYPNAAALRTPNLSVDSGNLRQSVFYVDLPIDRMSQGGGAESIDSYSDISDLGKAVNYDNLSDYSQFSDFNTIGGTSGGAMALPLSNVSHYEKQISNTPSLDARSLNSLRIFLDHPDSNFSQKSIPMMSQPNFKSLWTSLIEIVGHSDVDVQHACKWWCKFALVSI